MNLKPDQDKFTSILLQLMIPITIQQFFNAALALVDNMFIGQLGDVAVAAVTLSGQIFFILSLIFFGINSGSAIFTAQFWGKQDIHSIRKVVGINLMINLLIGILFTLMAEIIPNKLLSIYTTDTAVISMGSQYLRIYAIGFILFGISQGLYVTLRSTERVRIPMFVNSLALVLNTSLGFLLIFGKLGLPRMDAIGSATANAIARIIETITLIILLLYTRSPILHELNTVFPIKIDFIQRYLKTCLPVVVNELFWSLGVSAYSVIYAHISTEAVAATNISSNVENLAFVPFLALGNACAIMVGNRIGAGEMDKATLYSKRNLVITIGSAIVMGGLMFLTKGIILHVYKVSVETNIYTNQVITFLSIFLICKAWNMVMFIGILRAGGDTRFALILELSTMWLYAVPAAWISANIFHLPVHFVVLIVLSEELLKSIITFFRYRSRKWIHHLAHPAI
jgi:putative MATE family efflux protein